MYNWYTKRIRKNYNLSIEYFIWFEEKVYLLYVVQHAIFTVYTVIFNIKVISIQQHFYQCHLGENLGEKTFKKWWKTPFFNFL